MFELASFMLIVSIIFYRPYPVWQGISFTNSLVCPRTDISAALQPIVVKFCMVVQMMAKAPKIRNFGRVVHRKQ